MLAKSRVVDLVEDYGNVNKTNQFIFLVENFNFNYLQIIKTLIFMANLTGVWWQDGGSYSDMGEYFFRQIGNDFYGTGEPESGHDWKNVFFGTINGGTISVEWADVAGGKNRGHGHVTLKVSSDGNSIELTGQTENYFGGKKWKRE